MNNTQGVKLSHNQFKEYQENARRMEVAKQKAEFKLKTEALNQDSWVKAFDLTSRFQSLFKNTDDMMKLANLIKEKIDFKGVEFEEPTKPLDIVKP